MDRYHTAESWTGVPGAIAPADGNAPASSVAQAFRPEGFSSADETAAADRKGLTPEGVSYNATGAGRQDAGGGDARIDLGPNNERLQDVHPELGPTPRELVRRYRQGGAAPPRRDI